MSGAFENIVDARGRVNYCLLRDFVQNNSLSDFLAVFSKPFLISYDLYSNGMYLPRKAGSRTRRFLHKICGQYLPDIMKDSDIADGIYTFRDKMAGKTVYTIGRSERNDLILPSAGISKDHAVINCERETYFVRDCGSMNGTAVEMIPLKGEEKRKLVFGAKLSFGRFDFIFTHPIMVYRAFYKQQTD